jgi:hypothetical protein
MLALDDAELEIIMTTAAPIPRGERDQFLRDVAAELAKYEVVGPGIVARVCAGAQRRYFAAPSMHNGGGGKWR